jgi:ADP-dependent NAD(P)H-hydrate dehydratase / NAD(P)H-hydrate epimerase
MNERHRETSMTERDSASAADHHHALLLSAEIRRVEARYLAALPAGTLMARGPGNNGGDALLAALLLADRGWRVLAITLLGGEPAADDARRIWQQWRDRGLSMSPPEALPALLVDRPLVIDGLFGIGLSRALPPAASLIAQQLAGAPVSVVAVDVPSGLDADRGSIVGPPGSQAVRADLTVTMIADKPGLHTGQGCVLAGKVLVADLALPRLDQSEAQGAECGHLIDRDAVSAIAPHRRRDAHKGRFGDVLVIVGQAQMAGAALLAALGSQATGAGRLYLGTEDGLADRAGHPELMTRALRLDDPDAQQALGTATVIVIGCGLGTDLQAQRKLAHALTHRAALVLDADGLNIVAADPAMLCLLQARAAAGLTSVLTPHPLEAARLLGISTAAIQQDRRDAALRLAGLTGSIVVLKGAGSIVASADGRWSINRSGGPILSVAGTGDMLAGTIAGLLASGLSQAGKDVAETTARPASEPGKGAADQKSGHSADRHDSAATKLTCLAVWLHGQAGDALAAQPEWSASIGLPAAHLAQAIRISLNQLAAGRS